MSDEQVPAAQSTSQQEAVDKLAMACTEGLVRGGFKPHGVFLVVQFEMEACGAINAPSQLSTTALMRLADKLVRGATQIAAKWKLAVNTKRKPPANAH
jgi:hypothetical protein